MWVTGGCRVRQQLWRQSVRGVAWLTATTGVPTRGWRRVFLSHAGRFRWLFCDPSVQKLWSSCNSGRCPASFQPSAGHFSFFFCILCLRPPLPPTTSFGPVYMELYETEDIKADGTTKKKKIKITHEEVSGGKLLPNLACVLIQTQTRITSRLWMHRDISILQFQLEDGTNFNYSWT